PLDPARQWPGQVSGAAADIENPPRAGADQTKQQFEDRRWIGWPVSIGFRHLTLLKGIGKGRGELWRLLNHEGDTSLVGTPTLTTWPAAREGAGTPSGRFSVRLGREPDNGGEPLTAQRASASGRRRRKVLPSGPVSSRSRSPPMAS